MESLLYLSIGVASLTFLNVREFFSPFRLDLHQPSCTFIASITLQYIIDKVEMKFNFQFWNNSEIIWKKKKKTELCLQSIIIST